MNTASRMESTCRVGCVHVSETFGVLLPLEDWESTGGVEVKGKGLMQTRLWVPNSERDDLEPDDEMPNLRQSLTMASFTSTRSRRAENLSYEESDMSNATNPLMPSFGAEKLSDSESDMCNVTNPLMAIFQSMRVGEDEEPSGGGNAAGSSSLTRRKSYRNQVRRPSTMGHRHEDRISGGSHLSRPSHHTSAGSGRSRRSQKQVLDGWAGLDDRTRRSAGRSRKHQAKKASSAGERDCTEDPSYEPLTLLLLFK
eukprot:gene28570-31730_t